MPNWASRRWRPAINRLLISLLILAIASVMLVPVMMAFDFEPMPGDFAVTIDNHRYMVPVVWSLCAGAGLGLLYSVLGK